MLRKEVRKPLLIGLIASLLFNFAFHSLYGDDRFLYSAHWAFMVVAFAALSLRREANRWWFQAGLAGGILIMLVNNWGLLADLGRLFAR